MHLENSLCPVEYSDQLGRDFFASSKENKEIFGQYFTPYEVADFMASLLEPILKPTVRILDPGAGSGVLASAAVKALALKDLNSINQFHVDLFEIDPSLVDQLELAMTRLRQWCLDRGKSLTYRIRIEDFVLSNSSAVGNQPSLIQDTDEYDVVVSNPPYFKISKSDSRAIACQSIVHGQPNIYSLFMAIAAALLSKNGQLVFITPRSFASGHYFKEFRNYFFSKVSIFRIHQFISRVDAFDRDSVLQENIITFCKQGKNKADSVLISSSQGRSDLSTCSFLEVKEREILDPKNDFALSLPCGKKDLDVLRLFSTWTNRLEKMNLKISTGPVVPFRATQFLSKEKDENSIPLYWIHHVKPMETRFPLEVFRKEQWIKNSSDSRKLLVTNQNMILMRRFSPKEDFRRITVAPFIRNTYKDAVVGLENHLNYIYRPKGVFTDAEMYGLAAFLSSDLFDTYFRILNGNTQVSATELRTAPLPDPKILIELGQLVIRSKTVSHLEIDKLVRAVVGNSCEKN